ncbi:hypothetical protein [uncultured Phenylobacterium sp.]|uniref:hypothetical protein n=1 Tax=uncultured Phenylobacterium sp. TaxID=349273 RepID=UPI0025CC1F75|nr:hypothetical protein [uncultured Phenylobacterium sp.]
MTGGTFESDRDDFDSQDQSEAFDEDNTVGGGDRGEVRSFADADERATLEELPDVADLLQAAGDRDDDEAIALDADEFDPDAVEDGDLEEDDELDFRAATAEREDDLDGQGPDDAFNEARIASDEIDGLEEIRDAAEAQGGEDDVTDFQSRGMSDEALRDQGYLEDESDAKDR